MIIKALGLILIAYLAAAMSYAAIPATPILNFDAAGLADNADFQTWTNTGSFGGTVDKISPGQSGAAAITVGTVAGRKAVTFDGKAGMVSANNSPASITGQNPWTVAVWVYNPTIAAQEWLFQWGKRGTNLRCAHIGYGTHGAYGAMSHYGNNGDLSYDGGVPSAAAWHQITFTYDGSVERLYVDGIWNTQEAKVLNIDPEKLYVGRIVTGSDGNNFAGSIAQIRAYDVCLTQADVIALFTSTGGTYVPPAAPPAAPTVANPSFELDAYTTLDKFITSNYMIQGWTFNSQDNTGITRKGATYNTNVWTSGTADGAQVLFFKNAQWARQRVPGFKAGHAYQVSVQASSRFGNYNLGTLMLRLNGNNLFSGGQSCALPTSAGAAFPTYTGFVKWVAPYDGAFWLEISNTTGNTSSKDTYLLVDNVQITDVSPVNSYPNLVASPLGGQSWGTIINTTAASAKNIVLTNNGTNAINVSSVAISGNAKFTLGTVSPAAPAALAAGAAMTIPVTFTPSGLANGAYAATVTVVTDDVKNPIKRYAVTALIADDASVASKRVVLVDDTGTSMTNGNRAQFGGPNGLQNAVQFVNAAAVPADIAIMTGTSGMPFTLYGDFTIKQPNVTIHQVANGQTTDTAAIVATNSDQSHLIQVQAANFSMSGLSSAKKLTINGRNTIYCNMNSTLGGLGMLFDNYTAPTPVLDNSNGSLTDLVFGGTGNTLQSYAVNLQAKRVDFMPLSAGEGPRLSSGSAALPGSSTFDNCSVVPGAANASAFMIHESDMTSTTWNNSSFVHTNKNPNASQTQWGNTANLVRIKTTFNDCTFDWSDCQEPFMRGWIGNGHHLRLNNPTFVGATSDTLYNNQAFINFQENKTMTVEIYGTPTSKVDLRGIRNGVNKQTLIRNQNSTVTLVDCIYDDKIDINGARRGYPYWNANFNLDRCLALGDLGASDQAMPKIQVAVNATNTIFKMGAETTTSLYLVSGDSTSTANLTHCTFFSTGETTTSPSFLVADPGTSITMNYSIVKGPKPLNDQGYLSGASNVLAFGTQVNGTNLLTSTISAGPYMDNTGHIGAGSPAISNALFSPVKIDYDGDPRPGGTGSFFPDIGADETTLVPVDLSQFKVE